MLTTLGSHWSLDMMSLADCYRVRRLGVPVDLLGEDAAVKAPHPIVSGVLLSLFLLPDLFHTRRISMAFDGPLTTT